MKKRCPLDARLVFQQSAALVINAVWCVKGKVGIMSIVCATIKNGEVAIAADTQLGFGSTKVSAKYLKNPDKLYSINGNVIGIVGWTAVTNIVEHLLQSKPDLFNLSTRDEIYETLMTLHGIMKDKYFIETKENDDQPVESNQLDAIIINENGLFEIGSYRDIYEYSQFWAIGSGRRYALGAMEAIYETPMSAADIAVAGVNAACTFDDGCGLPVTVECLKLVS